VGDDQPGLVKITKRHGGLKLHLDTMETTVLRRMFADLAHSLRPDALPVDDPVRQRLYPAAHRDDEEAATEFRELTEAGLTAERLERIADCRRELDHGPIPVDGEAGDRWIRAVNDLRLAIGTRLDVTEDEPPELPPDDPDLPQWAAYYWLTGLQDALVRALMG
jgi:hypothetical protein